MENREYPQSQEMTVYNPGGHHHPQLLMLKVSSDKKVPLVKMSQDDPLNPSSK